MWNRSTFEKYMRDLSSCITSYWDDPVPVQNKSLDNVQIINDSTRFEVSMDVSPYKPEELRVHLTGRDLIIEGNQEKPSEAGYIQKSFLRRWALPDEVDLDAVTISLNEFGSLLVHAPKTGLHTMRRELPIRISPKSKAERTVLA
ncbi:Hsp20/alpha crystallin family protein [Ancylostoma caninum]|uniref:Hsp20/alpha crystallin family protein n=1 Tax=Ancylostoma caninum TaxID=29170 RepID=A0A368F1D0_ANCCA|nr:Hsp20/alpha crystallin family protein [Ancylostoma caninum]